MPGPSTVRVAVPEISSHRAVITVDPGFMQVTVPSLAMVAIVRSADDQMGSHVTAFPDASSRTTQTRIRDPTPQIGRAAPKFTPGSPTMTSSHSLRPRAVAVIVANPFAIAVADPLASMVITAGSLFVHEADALARR